MKTLALAAIGSRGGRLIMNTGTLTVTSLSDMGPGSLRDSVILSGPGDKIVFGVCGTILLNSSITIPHTLYVLGPGPDQLVVNANHADRAFVTGGTPVFLAGMTITNGYVAGLNGPDASSPGTEWRAGARCLWGVPFSTIPTATVFIFRIAGSPAIPWRADAVARAGTIRSGRYSSPAMALRVARAWVEHCMP